MASEIIKLNLIPKGEMPVFHCSQFDNGRLITIELYRGEDAYEVPAGYTVELHCRKVDNNIVTLASTLVNTNVVTFTSTTQLTACNGKNLCEVAIKAADDYLIGTLNFWLEVEVDPLKGGINSTSEIHDLYEQIEEITAEVIGDDYYDKTEVDNLLDAKADKSTTYTKTQVDTLLTAKADKSNVYTKAETTTLLAAKADADNVYTKAQVETKLAAKADAAAVYTKDETDTLLDAKANANAVYSKVEVDAMVDDLEDAIDLKADAATTYTKTEVDTALALKANAADVYTKQEIDNKFFDIMPVDSAGPSAIANFTTALVLPLVECKVGIVATGGNGTPDNPNPINCYTEANITANGDTVTIAFGQTVYGGVLDVTRGKLRCNYGIADLSNTSLFIFSYDNSSKRWQTAFNDIKVFVQRSADVLAEQWQADTTATVGSEYKFFTVGGALYFYTTDNVNKPVGNLVYPLKTPFDIDLTPEVISAIVGENNIYGDTNGDTTVKFKDTIQNYIDKKVST